MQPTSRLSPSKFWKITSLVFTLTTVLAYSSNSYLLNWLSNNEKHRTPKICSVLTWCASDSIVTCTFCKLAGDVLRNLFGLTNFKNHPEIYFHFMLQRESDWAMTSFIHTKHSWNKYHMIGVTQFVSAGWTNRVSGLHHRCALSLAPLCGRAERSGPPHTQGIVLSELLRRHHSFTSLAVGGRITITVAGPRELSLPAGGRQQWHEGVNTVEEKDGGTEGDRKKVCGVTGV